MTTNKR